MATISGTLRFDRDRTAVSSAALPGIANVPIVLQDRNSGVMLAVYTDANGNYTFTNVPDGNYQIVESYGTPAVSSPGDFSNAASGNSAVGITPPISYVNDPPPGTTNLDNTIPNTRLITISNADLSGQDFLNGPVKYTPIQTIMDSNVVVSPVNLIEKADSGTFGTYPQGTEANTGASPNPYPNIGSDFTYVLPNPASVTPIDGQYTIQNIMNNATANEQMTWWRIADHTTGNETGRMMVVNGNQPGAVFFQEHVPVTPNTYYLLSAWILNLSKSASLVDPQLGVRIVGSNGEVLYSATLGTLIPRNSDVPEWKQIGTAIYSQNNSSLTVEFTSMGPAAHGNDYVIDDITLNEVVIPAYTPSKSADPTALTVGSRVNYTVTLANSGTNPLTDITFQDAIPDGLTFVPGSVTVNGTAFPTADPNLGFLVPNLPGGSTFTITFSALAESIPAMNPTLNHAALVYSYSPVNGGIPSRFQRSTNPVPVVILPSADLSVTKTADPNPVQAGNRLTYTLNIHNNGPNDAQEVLVTDDIPTALTGVEYSVDGGATWQPWVESHTLGSLESGASVSLVIRGTVDASASGTIANTAIVSSPTADPDSSNNSSTTITPVTRLADLAVTKTADPNPVQAGNRLTYTLNIRNNGPNDAQNITVMDNIPSSMTNVEYSADGGATWRSWRGAYTFATLANGASVSLVIRGTVIPSASGTIANTAIVSSPTTDPNSSNNSSTTITPINEPTVNLADLSIVKTSDRNSAQGGNTLTYTLNIRNNGPDDAQGLTVIDEMPSALINAEYSTDEGKTWQLWNGTYGTDSLANGASIALLLRGTVDPSASGNITNTAIVSSPTVDPDSSNNSSTTNTPVIRLADLAITKAADSNAIQVGNRLTYALGIQNNGPNDAQNVTVMDNIPSSMTNVEYSVDSGATWRSWRGAYTFAALANGAAISLLIRGTVSPSASGNITNTAIVSSPTTDPDSSNNSSTVITPIIHLADLAITKTATPIPVQAGNRITYTLNIRNNGPDDAQDVLVTDDIPPSLADVEYSVDGGMTWQPWIESHALGNLANGASVSLLIRGTVNPSASGHITNTAIVSSPTTDLDSSNNSSTVTIPISAPSEESADLSIKKTACPTLLIPCATVVYTLTIFNAGPQEAKNVSVTDLFPEEIRCPCYSQDNGQTWHPWDHSILLGNLIPNTSFVLLLKGVINACALGTIWNHAKVISDTADPHPENNRSEAAICVRKITRRY